MYVRIILGILLAAAALSAVPVRADSDHDRARAAVAAGEVLPLPVILERVGRDYPGSVLEVELERDKERWVYELKLLRTDGGVLKLEVDAGDATVLRRRETNRR
jgi:uncharacterized membrane protein YkoI